MRFAQLAHSFLALAGRQQRAAEAVPDARSPRWKRNLVELGGARTKQRDAAREIPIAVDGQQAVTSVCYRDAEPVLRPLRVAAHAFRVTSRALEIRSFHRRFTHRRQQPLKSPDDISGPVGDLESRFGNSYRFPSIAVDEMV